jgi:hypothetical protein
MIPEDTKYTYNKLNILCISDFAKNGFHYITHTAYTYDVNTLKQSDHTGQPQIAFTYLIGDCKVGDVDYGICEELRQRVIVKMKCMNFKWVHQVYAGEPFISEDNLKQSRRHIFVRGNML